MNTSSTVNWLFLDLNSFFASCEQQDRPELRGRPVAVVQMITDSTCAIAASLEAKAYGVKTGTIIGEARRRCPGLVLVKARHRLYLDYHHRTLAALESCLPITKVCSIDEAACRLMGSERELENARALALKIKQVIRERVGLTCSIGLAPSLFLGKVASDMQKPDGLVVITRDDLPHILHPLRLTDIYGIGARMEHRLRQAGIGSVAELMQASRQQLRHVWGGVHGVLYYELLHGADLQFPSSPHSQSLSHQHVLEPELRTPEGAQHCAKHLLAKAAERLRHNAYYCRRLGLSLTFAGWEEQFWDETRFQETQDTAFLLGRLAQLWRQVPRRKPVKVGVVLFNLIPAAQHQPDLFANPRAARLAPLIDQLNQRYGRGTIGFGKPHETAARFTGHAAFQRVPETFEF